MRGEGHSQKALLTLTTGGVSADVGQKRGRKRFERARRRCCSPIPQSVRSCLRIELTVYALNTIREWRVECRMSTEAVVTGKGGS